MIGVLKVKNIKKYLNGRFFYSLAVGVLVVAVAATGAMILNGGRAEISESPYLALDESPAQVVVQEPSTDNVYPAADLNEETEPAAATAGIAAETEETAKESADSTDAAAPVSETVKEPLELEENLEFSADSILRWPVEGEILREFSMDTTVFYPTLNAYKVSPAILIQSEAGNEVLASADGVVRMISQNEELGTFLVMELGNGYELTYGQLENLQVSAGDMVKAGEILAEVAEPTIYYTLEGDNLYFQLTKDDVAVDPLDYMD